jgi:hypothetical protein
VTSDEAALVEHTWRDQCRLRPIFSEVLPPEDLQEGYFHNRTHLDGIHVGNGQFGYISLADVHCGIVNLT